MGFSNICVAKLGPWYLWDSADYLHDCDMSKSGTGFYSSFFCVGVIWNKEGNKYALYGDRIYFVLVRVFLWEVTVKFPVIS